MITILHEPKPLDFSGNGLAFELQGAGLIAFEGVLSKINENATFTEISKFELTPDVAMKAKVQLGYLIKDYISVNLPNLSNTEISANNLNSYRLQLYDRILQGGQMQSVLSLTRNYSVLKGKIPFLKFPDFDIDVFSNTDKNFLNWIDYNIYLFSNANFFLHYFFNKTPQNIHLRAKIFYTDHSSEYQNIFTISAQSNSILHFPCSEEKLSLNQYSPSKEIYKYQLALVDDSNNAKTNWISFFLIDKPLYVREFAFVNNFGVFEFFYTKTKRTEKLTTKRKEYKKNLPINYKSSDAEIESILEEAYNIFEIETGSITEKESLNISNMLISEFLYEIVDNKYIRCQLIDGSSEIIPEDDVFSVKFSYRYAFDK